VDKPEMVAGVVRVDLVYHGKKVVAEICILAQILLSKIRFVLFSYTRISYPQSMVRSGNTHHSTYLIKKNKICFVCSYKNSVLSETY